MSALKEIHLNCKSYNLVFVIKVQKEKRKPYIAVMPYNEA